MSNLTVQLQGEDTVTLDDMGDGQLVISSRNKAGETEAVPLTWGQLSQAYQALRPRYGSEAKNTDRRNNAGIDDIDAILETLG